MFTNGDRFIIRNRALAVAAGVAFAWFFASATTASAATLSISPAVGSYEIGDTFTISVRVSSADQAMNAASGVVHFPTELLQVTSLSKSPTIMSMWVQEPTYSNAAGTVNFEGVVLNPGFTGSSGTVIGITFKAKSSGTGTLSITAGSVLANDGSGTEILAGASTASVTITEVSESAPTPPAAKSAKPPKKEESSSVPAASTTSAGLQAPVVTSVTRVVPMGSTAEVVGASIYPGAIARLTLQTHNGAATTSEVTVEGNGIFTVQSTALEPGEYQGSVVVEKDGAESPPSESFSVHFEGKPLSTRFVELLSQPGIVLAFAIIIAFLLGMFSIWFLLGDRRRDKTTREVLRDVDVEVHKAFLTLRDHINRSLEEFEKEGVHRELTPAEKRFVHEMTTTIKDTERVIERDVHDAEK